MFPVYAGVGSALLLSGLAAARQRLASGRAQGLGQDELLAQIYEAAVMPERWPALLERIAGQVGALGGTLGRHEHADPRMIHSPGIDALVAGWVEHGYHIDNPRGAVVHRAPYPGFLTDIDAFTAQERAVMLCYRDFLTPLGVDKGAATAVTGASNEQLVLTIEAFPDEPTVRAGMPVLDALRPHLARAVVLASELQLRECRSAVEALERAGTGAAMLGARGQVIAANPAFVAQLDGALLDGRDRLRLAQRSADAALARALETAGGTSVPIRDHNGIGVAALHLIPVRRLAQEVFTGASFIALVARPAAHAAPEAGLIQALFDLTPSEASVARAIAAGRSIEAVARDSGKSIETVRSHLKRVFSKTGTGRQNELAVLLRGFAPPAGTAADTDAG